MKFDWEKSWWTSKNTVAIMEFPTEERDLWFEIMPRVSNSNLAIMNIYIFLLRPLARKSEVVMDHLEYYRVLSASLALPFSNYSLVSSRKAAKAARRTHSRQALVIDLN